MRTTKTLIRLGGCPGWSESSLGTQPFCWFFFCHVAAHFLRRFCFLIQVLFAEWCKTNDFRWQTSELTNLILLCACHDVLLQYFSLTNFSCGNIHPADAVRRYREFARNAEVKLIACALCDNDYSIVDQDGWRMMDVVGFDLALPHAISELIKDNDWLEVVFFRNCLFTASLTVFQSFSAMVKKTWCGWIICVLVLILYNWASSRENLSSGFATR